MDTSRTLVLKFLRYPFFILPLVLFLVAVRCSGKVDVAPLVPITMMDHFPSEDQTTELNYLWTPGMIIEVDDSFLISDLGRNEVLSYSLNGDFLGVFGHSGQGPGEFYSPKLMCLDAITSGIWIQSQGRATFVDKDGLFQSSFDLYVYPDGMRVLPTGELVFSARPTEVIDSIIAYTRDGELLWAASPPLDIEEKTRIPFLHSTSLIEIVDDKIWQFFMFFNLIRILNFDGEVIDEFELDDPRIKEKDGNNRREVLRANAGDQRAGPRSLVHHISESHGYIWVYYTLGSVRTEEEKERNRIFIYQLDYRGRVVTRWYLDSEVLLRIVGLTVVQPPPDLEICLLVLLCHKAPGREPLAPQAGQQGNA